MTATQKNRPENKKVDGPCTPPTPDPQVTSARILPVSVGGENSLWSRSDSVARGLNVGVLRLHGFGINKLDGRSTRRRIERAARKSKRKHGGTS